MYDLLYFIRMCMYIITIPLLIVSIITKNRYVSKNNFIISIFMLIYLILDIFLINELVNIGLEFLFYLIVSLIAAIILIISIVVNKKKLSKNIDGQSNYFIKHYSKLFIFPVVLIVAIVFLYELFIINNADLIMVYREQSFMFANSTQVAVNNSYGKSFSLKKELIINNKKEGKFLYYYFEDDDLKEDINIESYNDPNLEKINLDLVDKIYKDIISKKNNDEKYISMENIVIIEDTNYYIIEYYSSNDGSDRKVLYNNDKYITEFDAFGYLEEVYILK